MADPVLLSITLEFQRREDELCLGAISGLAFWLRRDRKSPTTVHYCRELADVTWAGLDAEASRSRSSQQPAPSSARRSAQDQEKEIARWE